MNTIFGIPANILLYTLLALSGLIVLGVGVTALRFPVAFRLGIRNLPRRKSQSFLIISGLALSTLIITSALGIGDTVDYSVKSGVYDNLGGIDMQIATSKLKAQSSFSFGSGAPATTAADNWFDAGVANEVAGQVDGVTLDASVAAAIQTLPVVNSQTKLSEAAVEIRGLGGATGNGLPLPEGLNSLADGEVLVNQSLATALDASIGNELMIIKGMPQTFTVAGIVPDGELAGSSLAVILPLERAQVFFGKPGQITAVFVSNQGDSETGAALSDKAASQLEPIAGSLVVNPVKAEQLDAAATSAEFITTLFVTFGTFSIVSGILLIFLIFSVLAAERKSEMGMSRAVGLQRADLVRQFVTEGLAYNLLAAALGAALGVGAAILLASAIASLLSSSTLSVTPRVSLRSVAIGYTLGLVISFVTVVFSAVRNSRVNIIAAIRNLNLPVPPRLPQWTLFLRPFTVWKAAVQKAGQGNYGEALRLFLFAGPKAVLSFWGGLWARGPVLLALGFLFAWVGVNVAKQSGVYGLGVSMFLIGLGQFFQWVRIPSRWAYTFTGLSLILYWSLPTREIGKLKDLGNNPGDFFISGMFLVGGAILLFLYNADTLLNVFAALFGRARSLLSVARVSVAYPVSAKGRTATTLAMFSLIIFTLVSTATITNTFSNFLDVEGGSGGYEILVQTNPFNPVSADKFTSGIDQLVADGKIEQPAALASAVFAPVKAQSPNMTASANYAINGADAAFFETNNLALNGIAKGYTSASEVWAALQADPTLIVVDGFSVERSGDPTFQRDESAFYISAIRASDTAFDPLKVQITGKDGTAHEFTVIGTLGSAPAFYGALMSAEAAKSLGYEGANRYFVRLESGADAQITANAIKSTFSTAGLQTSLLKEQLEKSRATVRSVFYLIQGFVGLGLLIGIAALGVITIRAVVERRQQIGVLRAIGFQRGMVQSVFLLESLFIAGLGTVIGYGLALTFAYNLYLQVAADQGLAFLPPWVVLAGIGAAIFAASLLTAWLPSRSTSKIVIAEALRYE